MFDVLHRLRGLPTLEAFAVPTRRTARAGVLGLLVWALAACGGNVVDGAGNPPSAIPPNVGALTVTVTDTFGTPVAGARVDAELAGASTGAVTNAQGVALLTTTWPSGTADVAVSRETFLGTEVSTPFTSGAANAVTVVLQRATAPAAGTLATRSGTLPVPADGGRTLSFEVEVVVVGADAQALGTLTADQFELRPCTPDTSNTTVDCVRRAGGVPADVAYAPLAGTPEALVLVPGEAARPFAAALLLDQSGSIASSDPTGARLFSAKALMGGLGLDDQVLLSAFASGPGALIQTPPVTLYAPFRTRDNAESYFTDLDALTAQVGGSTPLYAAIDTVRARVVTDAASTPGLSKAVVVFTDGSDTACGDAAACALARAETIAAANASGVRLFTIGLSERVDVEALGALATETGGAMLYAETAEQLLPLYGSVGRLLSLSLPTYRLRWTVVADAGDVFTPGASLLGRVRVTVDGRSFDVPFVVDIP